MHDLADRPRVCDQGGRHQQPQEVSREVRGRVGSANCHSKGLSEFFTFCTFICQFFTFFPFSLHSIDSDFGDIVVAFDPKLHILIWKLVVKIKPQTEWVKFAHQRRLFQLSMILSGPHTWWNLLNY